MIDQIPDITVPLIHKGNVTKHKLTEELNNKKAVIFGVPGAFTPTCSEKHLPDFISNYSLLKEKNIDDVYCLSVNDAFVMKAWLKDYEGGDKIIGIAIHPHTTFSIPSPLSQTSYTYDFRTKWGNEIDNIFNKY